MESCATKIVLRQDEAVTASLKEAFRLSEVDENFIVNAKIGQGILVTPEGRLPFYNMLSDEERWLFTARQGKTLSRSSRRSTCDYVRGLSSVAIRWLPKLIAHSNAG